MKPKLPVNVYYHVKSKTINLNTVKHLFMSCEQLSVRYCRRGLRLVCVVVCYYRVWRTSAAVLESREPSNNRLVSAERADRETTSTTQTVPRGSISQIKWKIKNKERHRIREPAGGGGGGSTCGGSTGTSYLRLINLDL